LLVLPQQISRRINATPAIEYLNTVIPHKAMAIWLAVEIFNWKRHHHPGFQSLGQAGVMKKETMFYIEITV